MKTMKPRLVMHCIHCCPGEYGHRDDATCPGHQKFCLHMGVSWRDIKWDEVKETEHVR